MKRKKFIVVFLSTVIFIWRIASPGQKWKLVSAVLLSLLVNILEVLSISLLIPFVALLSGLKDPSIPSITLPTHLAFAIGDIDTNTTSLSLLIIIISCCSAVIRIYSLFFIRFLCADIAATMTGDALYGVFEKLPHGEIDLRKHEISSDIVNESRKVLYGVFFPVIYLITNVLFIICISFFMISLEPSSFVSVAGSIGLLYFLSSLYCKRLWARGGREQVKIIRELVSVIEENVDCAKLIALSKGSYLQSLKVQQLANRLTRTEATCAALSATPRILAEYTSMIIILLFLLTFYSSSAEGLVFITATVFALQKLLPHAQRIYEDYGLLAIHDESVTALKKLMVTRPKENFTKQIPKQTTTSHIKLQLVDLSYEVSGKRRVQGVSVTLSENDRLCITGPSGSGKSTLADIIMGFRREYSGLIMFNGRDIRSRDWLVEWQHQLSYVPQDSSFVGDSLAEIFSISGDIERFDESRASESMKKLDIDQLAVNGFTSRFDWRRLSGGERQRLSISRAIYQNRKVLILDEPTSALDKENVESFLDMLRRIDGMIIICITHSKHVSDSFEKRLKISS